MAALCESAQLSKHFIIAAIAGSVAVARFGIPDDIAAKAWSFLPVDMRSVMTALYKKAQQ